ncbi:type II toxin-antitoxin system VapC family toxin [Pigmentiphaga sp. GD03639]|uniref:Type II toxin-antitoxin system VapC family toxin n=1 Tax=Pigmentiphaga daeguensis TaxID=414049 RepID=A0ABN1CYB5_9BURK|nr:MULTISPECIES: type II toxin-antitoxin system VapC family toxin [unclassified Pigmentiphaga]MDH2238729.1 type II toxin-antitoxin system VapC family toxin [Pigmentiphaga sp. GD03639]OVZ58926.1 VapC toxin family PIN domain ribonuclease [Pigmentiphaga sp. NML030171]
MKVTADTNIILRSIVDDDEAQTTRAIELLETADMVAVSLQTLCEVVWVLRGRYEVDRADIAVAIRALLSTNNVVVNRPAAEAGLALLEAGGDFADGVIAYDGTWLGAETFVSFDKKAVSLLTKQGYSAKLL